MAPTRLRRAGGQADDALTPDDGSRSRTAPATIPRDDLLDEMTALVTGYLLDAG